MVILVVSAISFVRAKLGSKIFRPLVIQPYAGNAIKRSYFLGLAFLESPLILAAITVLSCSDLLYLDSGTIVSLVPFFYTLIVGVSAAISIYYTGMSMYYFFSVFGSHPQYDNALLMQLIIFSSSFQAPFILFIVSLFIHKAFYFSLAFEHVGSSGYFVFFHLLLLLIVQWGVVKNMQKIMKEVSSMYRSFPFYIKDFLVAVLMQIGFLQAPYIFSFVTFLILLQMYTKIYFYKALLFSLITILFACVGFIVAEYSGSIAATAMKSITSINKKNNTILNASFLAQVILDSRIIYMLVLLLVFISAVY